MSCFYQMELEKMSFKGSEVKDCNFTRADLEEADFRECDLEKTIFSETNLIKTNFKYAFNFAIDPTINKLKKTKFSPENAVLLLSHLDIEID